MPRPLTTVSYLRALRSSPGSPRWRAGATRIGRSSGKALHLAKVTGATLVIAKLDRLSRNAAFLLTLRDSGVRFAAVDLPEANDLTVGIMALVAQQEREAISRRTKEAIAVARSRGVRLGQSERRRGAWASGQGRGAAAGRNWAECGPACSRPRTCVEDIRASGATDLAACAGGLNAGGCSSPRRALDQVAGLSDRRTGQHPSICGHPGLRIRRPTAAVCAPRRTGGCGPRGAGIASPL